MAEDLLTTHLTSLAYAAATVVGGLIGVAKGTKSWRQRLDEAEASIATILKSPAMSFTAEYVERIARTAADRQAARSSLGGVRGEARAAEIDRQVRGIVERELESLVNDLQHQRELLEGMRRELAKCASDDDLSRFAEGQAARWEAVRDRLGHIDGKIGTTNDRLELAARRGR